MSSDANNQNDTPTEMANIETNTDTDSGEQVARVMGSQPFETGNLTESEQDTNDYVDEARDGLVVSLREETLSVEKQWVQAGEILVRKEVTSHVQQVPVDLQHDELDVQRVPVNRPLRSGEKAQPRQEGDTLVIPVVEEEVVVTKRYVVREELRITRRVVTEHKELSDTVRKEEVFIEPSSSLETVNENNASDPSQRRAR